MKSLAKRAHRALQRRSRRNPTVTLPAELHALLPERAEPSAKYTYHMLEKRLLVANQQGTAVHELHPILTFALAHKISPDEPQRIFAAAFCKLPHSTKDVDITLTLLEESSFLQCPSSLTKLVDHLTPIPEVIAVAARLVMSPKGNPGSQKIAFTLLNKIAHETPDAIFPIEDLRESVIQTILFKDPGPTFKYGPTLARQLCSLPHTPAQALKTIVQLEEAAKFEFTEQFRILILRLRSKAETDSLQLAELAVHSRMESTSLSHLVGSILDANLPLPDVLVTALKEGRALSVMGYSRVLRWLRQQERSSDVDMVLKHARLHFPEVSAFAFMQIAQSNNTDQTEDIDTLVGNITNSRSFHKYLTTIYGEYTSLLPALKRETHDTLFGAPARPSDITDIEQAEVLAGTAALLVTQMSRLSGLRFGRPRESTALHDWGSANYADWLIRSAKVANTARMLLDTALELAPECLLALKTRAELMTQFAQYNQAATSWEAYLALLGGKPDAKRHYFKTLCQCGRHKEAARLATELGNGAVSYRAAHYTALEAFSGRHESRVILQKTSAEVSFSAIRETDIRAVTQPVRYEPVGLYALRNVSLVGTQLVGPAEDALGYDERFEITNLPAGKGKSSPGRAFCGSGGFIYDDAAAHEDITAPIALMPGLPSMYQSYYHAVIQNLGRLPWLLKQGLLNGRKLALPDTIPSWARQIVIDMGIPEDRIVMLDADKIYHAQDMLIPTPARMVGVPHPEILATLRHKLGVSENTAPKDGRRIFWSRKSAGNFQRALTNEAQLHQIAVDQGFEVFDPVGLSIQEQVAMLAETSVVAGATGGAFANQIFAPRGMKVICIAPRQSAKTYYPTLAGACQLDFYWVLGEFLNEGYHGVGFPQLPYRVNPDTFSATLNEIGLDDVKSYASLAAAT